MDGRAWLALVLLIELAKASQRCEPITITLCKDMGYNMTKYPNSYGHERQEEAGLEAHQFYPLVEVNCYRHLKFFLCTLYTPICQENYEKPVLPCMEMCIEAKKRCSPLMQQYGFKWPQALSCENLPRISQQQVSGKICAAPPDTPDHEMLEDVKMNKGRLITLQPEVVDVQCQCRCVRPFYEVPGTRSSVANVSGCAYPCHSPLHDANDQQFITSWLAIWSGTCFILSGFTVLTFLIEMDRFQYPERPIFMLAFCQLMVSIGFLVRIALGHDAVACDSLRIRSADDSGSACLLVFLLTYFFGMAASVWWVVLSLTWVLAAASKWGSEAIASYAVYYHLFAWALPIIQTTLVLVLNAIDGDPMTGICFVGNTNATFQRFFVIVPLTIYFVIGVFFLLVGFVNLWRIRAVMQKQHAASSTSKLTQLMSKIGIFSVLYTVPAMFVILVLVYEQHFRPQWEQSRLCSCAVHHEHAGDTYTLLALIKSASMLVMGWTSGVWIISRKTLASWRRVFCCSWGPSSPPSLGYQKADVIYVPRLPHQSMHTPLRHCPMAFHSPLPDKL